MRANSGTEGGSGAGSAGATAVGDALGEVGNADDTGSGDSSVGPDDEAGPDAGSGRASVSVCGGNVMGRVVVQLVTTPKQNPHSRCRGSFRRSMLTVYGMLFPRDTEAPLDQGRRGSNACMRGPWPMGACSAHNLTPGPGLHAPRCARTPAKSPNRRKREQTRDRHAIPKLPSAIKSARRN